MHCLPQRLNQCCLKFFRTEGARSPAKMRPKLWKSHIVLSRRSSSSIFPCWTLLVTLGKWEFENGKYDALHGLPFALLVSVRPSFFHNFGKWKFSHVIHKMFANSMPPAAYWLDGCCCSYMYQADRYQSFDSWFTESSLAFDGIFGSSFFILCFWDDWQPLNLR